MPRECDRDDIEELLAKIERADDWRLDDWDFSVGRFEAGRVEITAEWDPSLADEIHHAVREAIEQLAQEHEKGAPVDEVKLAVGDAEAAGEIIEKFRQQGEVYEPNKGFVRTT